MSATARAQQVNHVLKILHMPALVRTNSNALHIFLQCGSNHFVDTAVVPQVNDLGTHTLQNAAHDINGSIVPVKQAGSRDKTNFMAGAISAKVLH